MRTSKRRRRSQSRLTYSETRGTWGTPTHQNPGLKEYPTPGRYSDENRDARVGKRYVVRECFYKKEGRIWYCVVSPEALLKQPEPSRYGDNYDNIIFGNCLTESHKMIGEGFPEPLEGPQESFNTTLNMRKDNLSLALNKMHVVNRFANVDLESLVTSRPGGLVMADDATSAVMPIEHGDVTQSAYIEAQADESQMQEMSGVTDIQMGQAKTDKATVAQINFSTSSAKIDFYAAIVGETFYKPFYKCLATMIQKFETDERAYRVANEALKRELAERNMVMEGSVYDLTSVLTASSESVTGRFRESWKSGISC